MTNSAGPLSSERDSEEERGTLFRSSLVPWVLGAVVLGLVAHVLLDVQEAPRRSLDYSAFLQHVSEGHVEQVNIVGETQVRGAFTESAVEEGTVGPPPGGGESPARFFQTSRPPNHALTAFLQEYNEAALREGRPTIQFRRAEQSVWTSPVAVWGGGVGLLLTAGLLGLWWRGRPREKKAEPDPSSFVEAAHRPDVTFEDVAGLEEAKAEVAEVVEFLREPSRFTRLGGTLPTGVLLVGPPGTGKTLMGRAVAGEAGVPFFSISGSDFVEMFVGVGASRVRDLFDAAKEKAPCIIFIDEIDAVGRARRGDGTSSGTEEREHTLNQLLAEMDGFDSDEGVVIMAATNRPDVLDPALLRPGRFDRRIHVEKPDRSARRALFRVHVRDLHLDDSVDVDLLARRTPGLAGAEIANICNEAALRAARAGKSAIEAADFEEAVDRVVAGIEKKNKLVGPEERRIIAYHEAGHALVSWFVHHVEPVVKVSIVPRGLSTFGHAQSLAEERPLYREEELLDQLKVALGGRAAERLVFNQVTTGGRDDLARATEIATAMVVEYGMSGRIGPVRYDRLGGSTSSAAGPPCSDATAEAIDESIRALVVQARDEATDLLERRREQLEALAEALLDEEGLGSEALLRVIGSPPVGDVEPSLFSDVGRKGEGRQVGRPSSGPDAE